MKNGVVNFISLISSLIEDNGFSYLCLYLINYDVVLVEAYEEN